jgi:two-component system response regulator
MGRSQKCIYSVLLADDSDNDRFLMRRALRNHPRLTVVGEVCDGTEVIEYLSRSRACKDAWKYPFPDLLLLDLKMQFKNGFEVLQWLQTQKFKELLVVVLSGSSLPEDYDRSLALGAHAYYVKIPDRQAQREMLRSIEKLLDLAHEPEPFS